MQSIVKEEKDGRLVITQRGTGYKLERLLYEEIQDAHKAGYNLAKETTLLADISMRNYQSTTQGRWVGYKEGCDPVDKIEAEKKKEKVVVPQAVKAVVPAKAKEELPVSKTKKTGNISKNKK